MKHLTPEQKFALAYEIARAIRDAVKPILARHAPDHCVECVMKSASAAAIHVLGEYGSYTLGEGNDGIAQITAFVAGTLIIEKRQRELEGQPNGSGLDFECPPGPVH